MLPKSHQNRFKNDQKGTQNRGKVVPGGPGSPKKQIFETIEKRRKKRSEEDEKKSALGLNLT